MKKLPNSSIIKYLENCLKEIKKERKKELKAEEYWYVVEADTLIHFLEKHIDLLDDE